MSTALVAVAALWSIPAHAADSEQLASSVSITAMHLGAQICDEGAPVELRAFRVVLVCVKQEPPAAARPGTTTDDSGLPDEQPQPASPEVMVVY